jgi:dienelactone hydrolase
MKKLVTVLFVYLGVSSFAQKSIGKLQKPIIDTSVFNKWPRLGWNSSISNDGNYVMYSIENIPEGCRTLFIQSSDNKWNEEIPFVDRGVITPNSKKFLYKTVGDSLCIGTLGSNERWYISNVISYQISKNGQNEWMAFKLKNQSNELILRNLETNQEFHYPFVEDFKLSEQGNLLLIQTKDALDSTRDYALQCVDIQSGKAKIIRHGKRAFNYAFDAGGHQLVFITKESDGNQDLNALWYYNKEMDGAAALVTNASLEVDSNLTVSDDQPSFSGDANEIFFELKEKNLTQPKENGVQVEVWGYRDEILRSQQQYSSPRNLSAVFNLDKNKVILLEHEGERLLRNATECKGDFLLLEKNLNFDGILLPHYIPSSIRIVSLRDGSARLFRDSIMGRSELFNFPTSPSGKWLIYFDSKQKAYFSYEVATGIKRDLSQFIPVSLVDNQPKFAQMNIVNSPAGLGAWFANDSAVLIYDDFDIWMVDPSAKKAPVNITHYYGRKHHIKLRLLNNESILNDFHWEKMVLLTAFNLENRYSGFYQTAFTGKQDPELLSMGPWDITQNPPVKAKDADAWVVKRMSATEAPNYYSTQDFKTFIPLSHLAPQIDYNWLTTTLVSWKMMDGQYSQGILYKPENFDPHKKYPVIFFYYERKSDGLYKYLEPEASTGDINIPWFVSRGYLVFAPDIYYKVGQTGESVVNSVLSAQKYLTKMPWVDSQRMAIAGHSFGGFETNYLITHTHLFAAAAEAAGLSDMVSDYGSLRSQDGSSNQRNFETGQYRIGHTLWQRPDLYIKNSPVFNADQVTTPLLIMHNKNDEAVPWQQGIEFFNDLRRLGKRVWLLQYDREGHILYDQKNAIDYTIRLTQFFDYYLKDAPPPVWMTRGLPANLKGIDSGLELDLSGIKP